MLQRCVKVLSSFWWTLSAMVGFVFIFNINHPSSLYVAEPLALAKPC
jgi:hypothetical protein